MRQKAELIASVFFALFSLFFLVFSVTIPVRPLTVSARIVPQMVGGTIFVLSVAHICISFIKWIRKPVVPVSSEETNTEKQAVSNYLSVFLTLLFLSLYILGLSLFGFIISTFIFLSAQGFLLAPKPRNKKRIFTLLLVSAICTIVIYLIFRQCFKVALPTGSVW